MHTQKKKRLIKSVLSMAIIAGAAGAATGTYAWYSYQKEVNTELRGTTIKADKEIQVGLRWNEEDSLDEFVSKFNHGEIETQTDVTVGGVNCNIYWIRGNYVSEILTKFQEEIGSAQTNLQPITAGKYAPGDKADGSTVGSWTGFKMRPASETPAAVKAQNPSADYTVTMGEVTDMRDYFFLPLAFRVLEAEPDEDGNLVYAADQNIFLSKFNATDLTRVEIEAEGENSNPTLEAKRQKELRVDLAKALRVKADYPSHSTKADNFIFNPNNIDTDYRDINTGDENLPVGGVLNIQKDNFYDYDLSTKKEIAYGYFDSEVKYKAAKTPDDETITDFDDCDTFTAGHLPGGWQIDFTQTSRSICHINKSIVNEKRKVAGEPGADEGAKAIVTTDTNKIGFIDLSIYVEGWDKNVTNESAGREFSVELEFSIA